MRQKTYLFALLLLSVLWTAAMIAIGSTLPWSWGRSAVVAYALGIMIASFIRYHKCDGKQVVSKYIGGKDARVGNIFLSSVFFFIVTCLPQPWTLGNQIIIVIAGGAWIVFLREDIKISRRKNKKPSLRESTGPLPVISRK